jgi:hypothetical protein
VGDVAERISAAAIPGARWGSVVEGATSVGRDMVRAAVIKPSEQGAVARHVEHIMISNGPARASHAKCHDRAPGIDKATRRGHSLSAVFDG